MVRLQFRPDALTSVFRDKKDWRWFIIWIGGLLIVWIWNRLFLNAPALEQVETGFLNTLLIAFFGIVIAAFLGWGATLLDFWLRQSLPQLEFALTFMINLLRSIPQIVGILIGYVLLTGLLRGQWFDSQMMVLILMAFIIALFTFLEVFDLFKERIAHYRRLEFYDAMRVCGVSDRYIINREIIWRSSIMHLVNKLIALFGAVIFLLCSVDFIISVGLSTEISAVDLPVTLGSLLAKIDSKQDILAIGHTISDWAYIIRLPFEHLQGITVAFLIVFTLLCIYQIANGYAGRLNR